MRNMKKWTFFLLLIILILSIVPINAISLEEKEKAYTLYRQYLEDPRSYNPDEIEKIEKFTLYDINKDGLEELIALGGGATTYTRLVVYKNGKLDQILQTTWLSFYENGITESFFHIPDDDSYTFRKFDANLKPGILYRYISRYMSETYAFDSTPNANKPTLVDTTKSEINKKVVQLTGNKEALKLEYYDNTHANREKYLPVAALKPMDIKDLDIKWLERDYDYISNISEELAVFSMNGKFGFIDINGREILPPTYGRILSFSEGLAAFTQDGKVGFLDRNGKIAIGLRYDIGIYNFESYFINGAANVELDGKEIYINKKGEQVVLEDEKSRYGSRYSEGMEKIQDDDRVGYIDENGEEHFFNRFDSISDFHDGVAVVRKIGDSKLTVIDKKGRELFQSNYRIGNFEDGVAEIVDINGFGHYGFIDKRGKIIVPAIYDVIYAADHAGCYADGLILLHKDNKFGYADKNGKIIIPIVFDHAKAFRDGYAIVELNGKWGILKNPLKNKKSTTGGITAKYSKVNLSFDGKNISNLEIYNIDGSNYFKLRDIAKLASDSDKKFSVEWNNSKKLISLVSGVKYKEVGGELSGGNGMNKTALISNSKLELNGKLHNLQAYSIGGNTYYKIRDLAGILNIKVDWDNHKKMIKLSTN